MYTINFINLLYPIALFPRTVQTGLILGYIIMFNRLLTKLLYELYAIKIFCPFLINVSCVFLLSKQFWISEIVIDNLASKALFFLSRSQPLRFTES